MECRLFAEHLHVLGVDLPVREEQPVALFSLGTPAISCADGVEAG